MIKNIFSRMFFSSMNLNKKNILGLLEKNKNAKFLDLGCDDGIWTMEVADKIQTVNVYGVDITEERLRDAEKLGIKTIKADLNEKLPLENDFFDVVHANQVVEHIGNLDGFVSEIYRILKPGGYAIISTENASSWHNIFASIMGWQIFSLTNISAKSCGIGNPLAIHRGSFHDLFSWTHKTVFNYRGLKEFFNIWGFGDVEIRGAGYYPLPSTLGNIDVRHSHFITLKAIKK